jgi:hypothetical protein
VEADGSDFTALWVGTAASNGVEDEDDAEFERLEVVDASC